MQYARGHIPASARLQPVGSGNIGNLIIPLGEILQAALDIGFGSSRLQAEKGIWEMSTMIVELRWEIICFRFAPFTDQLSVLVVVVDVVRLGAEIIKEFRIHGPAAIFIPYSCTNEFIL